MILTLLFIDFQFMRIVFLGSENIYNCVFASVLMLLKRRLGWRTIAMLIFLHITSANIFDRCNVLPGQCKQIDLYVKCSIDLSPNWMSRGEIASSVLHSNTYIF